MRPFLLRTALVIEFQARAVRNNTISKRIATMPTPLIGITTFQGATESGLPAVMLQQTYVQAILQAGGLPVLIPSDVPQPLWRELFERLDGILFTGGGDIALTYFEGEPHSAIYGIDDARDAIEVALTRFAADEKKPFLGICRGIQVINVALGGTLYTHILDQLPNALEHSCTSADGVPARTRLTHSVQVEPESQFCRVVGQTTMNVNSLHHQGIKAVAPALKAVAYAPDGLVEAVEMPAHPFGLAVQFHPEWLTDQEPVQRLFKAFVEESNK
jgi:putative glutamine amidotransferase